MKNNTFNIISGKLKGRKFQFPDETGLRPTSGKIRETLFNWLQFDIANKIILDPFAGSGALGIEAISRGAKKVLLVEKSLKVFKKLKSNLEILNNSEYKLLNQDSLTYLNNKNVTPFDLIFLDPPFENDLIPQILKMLSKNNFLANNTKLYIESEYKITSEILNQYIKYQCTITKQKKSGNVHYCLISFNTL
ncbi:16S rRNA (guanine(966)-N(2))-methyltransferase RsmD [Candidatus Thioglobus sp. NP1]|nr:16S rRNA (guanine(966)-N(2))-methyltransferase RsmD [Candidatus Thioglobus sp. NP1]